MEKASIEECVLNKLPNILNKHLSSFFDFDSLINFSSTNQKLRKIFLGFRSTLLLIKESDFIKNFKEEKREKRNYIEEEIKTSNNQEKLKLIKNLIIVCLLQKDLSNLSDKCSLTLLDHALKKEKLLPEMIIFLVENKCSLNSVAKITQNSPLHIVCERKDVSLQIVKCLVDNKADLTFLNINKSTPLHSICQNKNSKLEIIKYLGKYFIILI